MKHPQYRDAHATDDHFMSAMFVAGAVGDQDDAELESTGTLHAEDWELVSLILVCCGMLDTDMVTTDEYVQLAVHFWEVGDGVEV